MRRVTATVCRVVMAFCLLALAACSSEESRARGEYLAGCMQSGADKVTCDCTYDKILKFYTFKELKAMSQSASKIPPDFFNKAEQAVMICKKELGW